MKGTCLRTDFVEQLPVLAFFLFFFSKAYQIFNAASASWKDSVSVVVGSSNFSSLFWGKDISSHRCCHRVHSSTSLQDPFRRLQLQQQYLHWATAATSRNQMTSVSYPESYLGPRSVLLNSY